MTTKQPPIHDENCHYIENSEYTVGCVGCVHQLITDSKDASKREYHDNLKTLTEEQKKTMEEKIEVFIYLESMFP